MLRCINALVLCLLLAVGCDRAQQTSRREVEAKPKVSTHGTDGHNGASPHGASPHGASPHGMPGGLHGGLHGMPGAGQAPPATGPEVDLGGKKMTAPQTWVRKQPRSAMLLAEFSLPHVEEDSVDGRLTVMAVGGSVEANIDRWREQFLGKPKKDTQERLDVAGIPVILVDLSGAYSDQHGMSGPVAEQPQFRMRAAIFDLNGRQHIIKCYGPAKTMAHYDNDFLAFVKSLGSKKKPAAKMETTKADSPKPKAVEPKASEPKASEPKAAEPKAAEPKAVETDSGESESTESKE